MESIMGWAKALAIFGGVIVGIFAVFCPSWVYLRRQVIGFGALALCGFGTILIVASVFREVSFSAAPTKVEFKLAEIQGQLQTLAASVQSAKAEIERVQVAARVSQDAPQFASITQQLDALSTKVEAMELQSIYKAIMVSFDRPSKTIDWAKKLQGIGLGQVDNNSPMQLGSAPVKGPHPELPTEDAAN